VLLYLMIALLAIALGLLVPMRVAARDVAFGGSRSNAPGIQASTTATLPPAIATAVPTATPTRVIVGEGPNMTFMIALLVIAGGAVLLWRRQRPG
jgi:hypothetical protein